MAGGLVDGRAFSHSLDWRPAREWQRALAAGAGLCAGVSWDTAPRSEFERRRLGGCRYARSANMRTHKRAGLCRPSRPAPLQLTRQAALWTSGNTKMAWGQRRQPVGSRLGRARTHSRQSGCQHRRALATRGAAAAPLPSMQARSGGAAAAARAAWGRCGK